jgi:hypothetical protein
MNTRDPSSNQDFTSTQSTQRTDTWQFVVINHPHAARSEQSRRRVRSHAMRYYHQQSRDLMTRGIRPLRQRELELDIAPLLERPIQYPTRTASREDELYGHRKLCRHTQEPV